MLHGLPLSDFHFCDRAFTSRATNVTGSSLDFSEFVGLADLWERRDRAFACATIPDFQLEGNEPDGEDSEETAAQTCTSSSPSDTSNSLIDEAETDLDEAETDLDRRNTQ